MKGHNDEKMKSWGQPNQHANGTSVFTHFYSIEVRLWFLGGSVELGGSFEICLWRISGEKSHFLWTDPSPRKTSYESEIST